MIGTGHCKNHDFYGKLNDENYSSRVDFVQYELFIEILETIGSGHLEVHRNGLYLRNFTNIIIFKTLEDPNQLGVATGRLEWITCLVLSPLKWVWSILVEH